MSTERLFKGAGRGCLQHLALRFGLALLLIPFVLVCLALPLYILVNSGLDENVQMALFIVLFIGFIALLLAGIAAVVVWIINRRARTLDAGFTPHGLTGKLYMINGRQYTGQFAGRDVNVYYYRGPTLDLYVKAQLNTRGSITRSDKVGQAISGMIGYKPIANNHPQLAGFVLYAVDPDWLNALIAQPGVAAAIARLLTPATDYEIRSLFFQPEQILLKLTQTDANTATDMAVQQTLTDLTALTRAADAVPQPTVTTKATAFESSDHGTRQQVTMITTIVVVGIFGLMAVCLSVVAVTIAMSGSV